MKAIPTKYGGTNFRSRLEARWAAFFDLSEIRWSYEPIDLDGWCPDFGLDLNVLVEVKPVNPVRLSDWPIARRPPRVLPDHSSFEKAKRYRNDHVVMLLGTHPNDDADYFGLGILSDFPAHEGRDDWLEVNKMGTEHAKENWIEAGNRVQWKGSENA